MASDSRLHGSGSASSSRPFLNLLNPIGRNYQRGYLPVNSVQERDEDDDESDDSRQPATQQRRVSLGASSSRTARRDYNDEDSSDGEVPRSFMVEAGPTSPAVRAPPPKRAATRHPTNAPLLPVTNPRATQSPHARSPQSPSAPTPKRMGQLDAREQALWEWLNVYNLDAYLQEVGTCS